MSEDKVRLIRSTKQRFYDIQSDLVNSKFHNFGNHFDVFIDFCENDGIMKEVTTPLKNDDSVDIQKWWDDIFKTGGSMAGSQNYELPRDPNKQASIFYQFFLGIKEGKYDLLNFCLHVYGETRYDDMIYAFNNDITNKLVRFLNRKINGMEDAAKEEEGVSQPSALTISDPRIVFVVHGRNLKARDAMFVFLSSIGLRPLEWNQAIRKTGKGSPYIGEILDTAFTIAQAIVVLMTPDDEARLVEKYRSERDPEYESELTTQPRQNVLFEAGMAIGRNQDRTILVELGTLRQFSDIYGRHTVRIDNTAEKRRELASRLETAGCEVDITGTTWMTTGDFDSSLT